MDFFKQFDSYALQARVYPALLVLLPALATVLAWLPSLLTSNVGAAVLTVINTCGLLTLFAELSRSQGQRAQPGLLKQWDGFPSTRILRHRDATLPTDVKARYHRYLSSKIGDPLPTAPEEQTDPKGADARYASATMWLKEQCRGPGQVLILNENTSYGFRRNLFGLKPIGILISAAAAAWPVVAYYPADLGFAWLRVLEAMRALEPVQVGALALSMIALCGWIFVVRSGWVKEAAEFYAVRLLAACDIPA